MISYILKTLPITDSTQFLHALHLYLYKIFMTQQTMQTYTITFIRTCYSLLSLSLVSNNMDTQNKTFTTPTFIYLSAEMFKILPKIINTIGPKLKIIRSYSIQINIVTMFSSCFVPLSCTL